MPAIEVLAPPVPKARPRLGKGGHVFTPRSTELAEQRIREAWLEGWGNASMSLPPGPLAVTIRVDLARPLGHYRTRKGERLAELLPSAPRWPDVRPDIDNYVKTALDALRGVAFQDDGQIVWLNAVKSYAVNGQAPGWLISVDPMEEK